MRKRNKERRGEGVERESVKIEAERREKRTGRWKERGEERSTKCSLIKLKVAWEASTCSHTATVYFKPFRIPAH